MLKQRSGFKRETLLGGGAAARELALFLQNYCVQSVHSMRVWGQCLLYLCVYFVPDNVRESLSDTSV